MKVFESLIFLTYLGQSNVMEGLHNYNVVRSSLHRTTCDDVSCFMEDTFQKKSFLSIVYLCVGMYYLGVCVYVCVHMEVSHIFFI